MHAGGLFGFLVAFMAGFLVYGAAPTAGTLALKWAIIGGAKAGVHRCASCAYQTKSPILLWQSWLHCHEVLQ